MKIWCNIREIILIFIRVGYRDGIKSKVYVLYTYHSNKVRGAGIAESVTEQDLSRLRRATTGRYNHVQQHVSHDAPIQIQG